MHAPTTRSSPSLHATPAIVLALVLLVGLALGGAATLSMGRVAPGTQIPQDALASPGEDALGPMAAKPPVPAIASGPGWGLMTTPQKLALYPLAERWAYLSEAQKRYWLTLAQNFASMPEAEQDRLHARMTAWASLSAQQRSQARLNFAVTRSLAPHDILSEWEIYQALSEADKQRLAAKAAKPRGAATALKPVPAKRLAQVPQVTGPQAANPPKIVFPVPAPVRQPPPPDAAALPPPPPAPMSDNVAAPPAPAAADPSGASAPTDPLPPVYVN